MQETDIVTCSARVILRRASHSSPGALIRVFTLRLSGMLSATVRHCHMPAISSCMAACKKSALTLGKTCADALAPRGTSVLAYAPLFPHPKEEKWNFIVADTANNTVFNRQEVSLIEAEAVGISHPVSTS